MDEGEGTGGTPGRSFETLAVHAGRDSGALPDPAGMASEGQGAGQGQGLGRPVAPGIQPASSFAFESFAALDRAFEGAGGYVYARHGSPTVDAFARAVAALEGAPGGVAFASGMAAIHAVALAAGVGAGSTIVAGRDLYGATQTLFASVLAGAGVRLRLVDTTDVDATRAAIEETRPRLVFVETISNPLLRVTDLGALATIAHDVGATLVVDNTFASPYLCRPVAWGADAVVHSATKALGGHGDLTAGVVVAGEALLDPLRTVGRLVGGTLGAFDAWLALRGVRTLALRQERQCANAAAIASYLKGHRAAGDVHYPGLPGHPQHALAARLFEGRGFGGVVSFTIRGAGPQEVARFMDALELIIPAPTMGDVYSLALYPARASHRGLAPEQRRALGIGDDLVRLSIGVEGLQDLLADLERALAS